MSTRPDPGHLAVTIAIVLAREGYKPTIRLSRNIMGEAIAVEVRCGRSRVASFEGPPWKAPRSYEASLKASLKKHEKRST